MGTIMNHRPCEKSSLTSVSAVEHAGVPGHLDGGHQEGGRHHGPLREDAGGGRVGGGGGHHQD